MKLNEIKRDIIKECFDWISSYVSDHYILGAYEEFKENFYDNFFMAPDGVPVLKYDTKQLNIGFDDREWQQPPFRVRAATIRFAYSDCRNIDLNFIDPIIDDMELRLTECRVGNCQKFIDAEERIQQFDISTSDISNVVEMLRVCESVRIYFLLPKSQTLIIESLERSVFHIIDTSTTNKTQHNFTDIFDVQTWLIDNGYEEIV